MFDEATQEPLLFDYGSILFVCLLVVSTFYWSMLKILVSNRISGLYSVPLYLAIMF